MPVFTYKALSSEGTLIKAEGYFESVEELYYFLQQQGLVLVDYGTKRRLIPIGLFRRYKRKDLAELLHQLSFMLKSGLSLRAALEDLREETPRLKSLLNQLIGHLARGDTFSEAVKKTKAFPGIVETLIKIGESTGTLDCTLEDASQHLYRVEEILSNIKRALIYPAFVLFAMLGALAFWFFFVLPQILKVFKEMQLKLPIQTVLLMEFVEFLSKYKFYIPLVFLSIIITFFVLYHNRYTQIHVDRILLKLPILGRIKKLNFLAFFFEYFSLMLSAGIDILMIFEFKREAYRRKLFKSIVERLRDDVVNGESISNSMRKEKIFRPLDIRMVSVGETTGRLEEQMKMLANFYYQEVKNLVDSLTKILEPVILVFAGIVLFIIIIALLGPLYDLISQVGKA